MREKLMPLHVGLRNKQDGLNFFTDNAHIYPLSALHPIPHKISLLEPMNSSMLCEAK
jgi:hypothetical protein